MDSLFDYFLQAFSIWVTEYGSLNELDDNFRTCQDVFQQRKENFEKYFEAQELKIIIWKVYELLFADYSNELEVYMVHKEAYNMV